MRNLPEYLDSIKKSTRLLDNFLDYVKFDTQSDPTSNATSSLENQKIFGRHLVGQLLTLGTLNAHCDEHGYVYATLPATSGSSRKTVTLLAHMDVAPSYKGCNVKPILHHDYQAQTITLPAGITIAPAENPELLQCRGETIITSDGTTLLGTDNKAGISAIMALIELFYRRPELPHPEIKVCFTPNEEIGRGVEHINLQKITADFAFTIDGGFVGEINYENFDAFSCNITFKGIGFHPGTAKGKMINAARYAAYFITLLPDHLTPERTFDREPFIHLSHLTGDVSEARLKLLLRGFSIAEIERERKIITEAAGYLKTIEPKLDVIIEVEESYRNMAPKIQERPDILSLLDQTCKQLGIQPEYRPIRGGTDGARLSFMGLACPNIFAGGVNHHSPKEWISFEKMATTTAYLAELMANIYQR